MGVIGMEAPQKIIYYDDPLNDEFSTAVITPRPIDGNWVYIPQGRWKQFTHFFWYRIVAQPIGFAYMRLKFHHKMVGREKLPRDKKQGYFLYGNHTQALADPVVPTKLCHPKPVYVIVHPNNVSMPYLGRVTPSMGALPLPDDMAATRNFVAAVKQRIEEGAAVTIYPEAHIWPYYTGIRPFPDKSFGYPVRMNVPVYCFTNTYQKRGRGVQMVTYVDGPFYPDENLSQPARKKALREQVYSAMVERAKNSNIDVIEYRRREDHD